MAAHDHILTAAQCRAARGLIAMDQGELAELAGTSPTKVSFFESGRRVPDIDILVAIRAALEVEGVVFISQDTMAPGVRLRDPVKS